MRSLKRSITWLAYFLLLITSDFTNGHIDPAGEADNIRHAHALFKGLKRPMNSDEGAKIYIYVVRPRYAYKYVANMVCVAERVTAQKDTVFAAYVKFNDAMDSGAVINWEWLVANQEEPSLPKDFRERYDERIW